MKSMMTLVDFYYLCVNVDEKKLQIEGPAIVNELQPKKCTKNNIRSATEDQREDNPL